MDARYHVEITKQALGEHFSPPDLQRIIAANLGQDSLSNLLGHPEIHFDDSAFAAGERYIDQQRSQALAAVQRRDREAALAAFGRLLHGRQDFYAHSNWLLLWTEARGGATHCSPDQVEICRDPVATLGLISGRGSVRDFLLVRLPGVRGLYVRYLLRPDSHEAMHLDNPSRGPLFPYAMAAAVKHTRVELDTLLTQLQASGGASAVAFFLGT